MAGYDGSVRIKTDIDSKNASAQLMSLENRIVKMADKVASLRSKMDSLKDAKIPTQEYQEVSAQIEKAEQEFNKLLEKQEQMQREGKDNGVAWDRLNDKIEQAGNTIRYAEGELQDLVDTGKAFTLGSETQEYANLAQQLGYAENELSVLNKRHDELIEKQNKTANGYKKIGEIAKSSLEKASKSTEKNKKALEGMSSGLKTILKYGFGIRSLYVLFNKVRAAIKEGFTNLYNSSAKFKSSVDGLKASATTLKNSFASAFAPIVEMAIPYIQMLMDYLSRLLGMVAQFTAAITGQKTYKKAIKQTTAAIKDQTKANGKQLSSLDKLNNLTSQSGADTNSGAGAMFEEVPIDTSMLDFVDKLKKLLKPIIDYAKKLKDIFMQGFWDGLGDWQYRLDSIKNSLLSIKDSLIDIFTDPNVLNAADEWAKSVAYMLGSLAGSIASIGLTIATNLIGGIAKYLKQNKDRIKEYLISMFDISTEINMQLAEFFQTIAYIFEAFASEQAQQLTANIIGIFVGIFIGITQLAQKLIRDIVALITQPFIDNKEAFRQALEGFLGVLSDVTGTIKQGIDDTFDYLNQIYDEHVKPFFDSVTQGMSELTGQFLDFWNNNVQPMLEEWGEKFDTLWKEHIQPSLNNIGDSLGKVFDSLKELWEDVLKPFISWIIENVLPVLLPIFDQLFNTSMDVFSGIIDVISDLMSIFADFVNLIVKLLKGDFKGAWESAKNIVATAISGIKRILDSAIKTIVNWADTIKGIFNSISGKSKNVSAEYSVSSPRNEKMKVASTYNIPGYATGQVIPTNMKKHLAYLGDNPRETEVVSPLSTMKQALKEAVSELGGIGTNGDIVIQIDGREVFRATQKQAREYKKQTGSPAFG